MKFDDSDISEYQEFKVDKLPTIVKFEKVIATNRVSLKVTI